MKRILLIMSFLYCLGIKAQQKVNFGYDNAGNQISRVLCLRGCSSKPAKDVKEIDQLVDEDMEKFAQGDVISYYPNPVKDELYIRWEVNEKDTVSSITILGITGQILYKISNIESINSQNLSFAQYPSGVYLVVLNYTNRDQKTIKIIKQ